MSGYKDRAEMFRSSARLYLSNKNTYKEYQAGKMKQSDERLLGFVKEDMQFVEQTLDEIKEKCGTAARLVVYLLYVENRTQENVAGEFRITRRQLQHSLNRWMNTVFNDDDQQLA